MPWSASDLNFITAGPASPLLRPDPGRPLQHDIASALLDALIGPRRGAGTDRGISRSRKRAERQLFLEESVRSLVETGVLNGKHADLASQHNVDRRAQDTPDDRSLAELAWSTGYRSSTSACAAGRGRHWLAKCLSQHPAGGGKLAPGSAARGAEAPPGCRIPLRDKPVSGTSSTGLQARARSPRRSLPGCCVVGPAPHAPYRHTSLPVSRQVCRSAGRKNPTWLAFHAVRAQAWDRAVVHLKSPQCRSPVQQAALRFSISKVRLLPSSICRPTSGPRWRSRFAHRPAACLDTAAGASRKRLIVSTRPEQITAELRDGAGLGRIHSAAASCAVLKARYAERWRRASGP